MILNYSALAIVFILLRKKYKERKILNLDYEKIKPR